MGLEDNKKNMEFENKKLQSENSYKKVDEKKTSLDDNSKFGKLTSSKSDSEHDTILDDIVIEGSHKNFFTPSINFNAKTGICELSGESFLEDTVEFYRPLVEWLETYTQEIKKPIAFIIKLTYFNTSTSRCILDLLNILKDYEDDGGEVVVNWHFDENDTDMEEDIEDYMIDTGLKINLIPF